MTKALVRDYNQSSTESVLDQKQMEAKDMVSRERGLNLPVPGVGERLKKIVKRLTGSGNGVMQASGLVEAPSKPATETDESKKQADELIEETSSRQPPEKPKKPSWVRTKAGRIGLTVVGALGSIGVGVGVVHQINPDIFNRPTASRPAETPAPTLAPKENPFPFTLDSSSFAAISQAEEKSLWENTKTVDLENHTFTIGFPVNQDTINKSPNIRYNSYFDPAMFGRGVDTDALEKAGMKSITQISGLPKDTPIYYSYDFAKFDASIIAITIAGTPSSESAYAYTTLLVLLRDKQTGKKFEESLSVLYPKSLVQPASYPKDHRPTYEDGTPINPNEPILQLTTDLQDWDGKGKILPGQKGQVMIDAIGGGLDPITSQPIILSPKFLKDTNGRIVPSTNK